MSGCELGAEAAFAFIEACEGLESSGQIRAAFQGAIERLGFKSYIISALPGPSESPDAFVLLNTWPIEWYRRYVDKRYFEQDPVGLIAARIPKPFAWKDMPTSFLSPRRSAVLMGEAREFGFVDGFCVPTLSPVGRRSVVALAADAPIDLSPREAAGLQLIALTAFGRLLALRGDVKEPVQVLSNREREVLTWAASGKSAWEISRILGVRERTIIAHLENVRGRLGVATTMQAVVTCMRTGEIQPL